MSHAEVKIIQTYRVCMRCMCVRVYILYVCMYDVCEMYVCTWYMHMYYMLACIIYCACVCLICLHVCIWCICVCIMCVWMICLYMCVCVQAHVNHSVCVKVRGQLAGVGCLLHHRFWIVRVSQQGLWPVKPPPWLLIKSSVNGVEKTYICEGLTTVSTMPTATTIFL